MPYNPRKRKAVSIQESGQKMEQDSDIPDLKADCRELIAYSLSMMKSHAPIERKMSGR